MPSPSTKLVEVYHNILNHFSVVLSCKLWKLRSYYSGGFNSTASGSESVNGGNIKKFWPDANRCGQRYWQGQILLAELVEGSLGPIFGFSAYWSLHFLACIIGCKESLIFLSWSQVHSLQSTVKSVPFNYPIDCREPMHKLLKKYPPETILPMFSGDVFPGKGLTSMILTVMPSIK